MFTNFLNFLNVNIPYLFSFNDFVNNPVVRILAQIIGYIGAAAFILSYQFKKGKKIIFMMLLGSICFSVSMFMLGELNGALVNVVSLIRTLFFYLKKKKEKFWLWFFLALTFVPYILSFTVFREMMFPDFKWYYLLIELLPVIAMCAVTVSQYTGDAKIIRLLGFIDSPCCIAYYAMFPLLGHDLNVPGILCDSFMVLSIIISLIIEKFSKKKKTSEETKN